jgi:hypothetical protein
MPGRTALLAIALTVTLVAACDYIPLIGSKYAAEVGYLKGSERAWDIWGDFTLDECRDAAKARLNLYNRELPGRSFSWACLKKNRDGSYESRHR